MTRLSPADANDELVRSKAEIERRVGRPVEHFAFPNENASNILVGLAARAGYRTVCVAGAGEGAARSGIRALRRTGIHEGVCVTGSTYDDALLGLGLLRAPKSQPA
jgi:hypothetical protein